MKPSNPQAPDRPRRALLTAASLWAAAGGSGALAQLAGRALRIFVAAPPGGTPDVVARNFGARMGGAAGLAVENRPGAAGLLAVSAMMQAPADGSATLLGHSGLATMYPFLYPRLPYDAVADLVPVAPAAETAFGLAVGPAVPAEVQTLADYVRWARADVTRATYGTPGIGTLPHILGALLAREGGFEARHIAYGGGPPAINDLVGGRLSSVVLPDGLLRQLHQAGRLRILATSGPARQPTLPGVPTLIEEGFKALVVREWWGFFVPRGTPWATIDALAAVVHSAAVAPELMTALDTLGLRALSGTGAQMAERVRRERAYWRDVLPTLGIRME